MSARDPLFAAATRATEQLRTQPRWLTLDEIRAALQEDVNFAVWRGTVRYLVGYTDSPCVHAWVAADVDDDEDTKSCKEFGEVDPFTGRAEAGVAETIFNWQRDLCLKCDAPIAEAQAGFYRGLLYCSAFCDQFGLPSREGAR